MSEKDTQGEPTMEEILDSIRRIISEDDEDAGADVSAEANEENDVSEAESEPVLEAVPDPEPEPEVEPEAEPEADEPEAIAKGSDTSDNDVLELTEEMEEPAGDDDLDPVPAKSEVEEEAPEEVPEDVPENTTPAELSEEPMVEPDVLVADVTEKASQEAFDRLSALMVAGYDGAGNTLEGLVRQLLKPMLQAYLDDNLPEIVRDVVEREVARIARKE